VHFSQKSLHLQCLSVAFLTLAGLSYPLMSQDPTHAKMREKKFRESARTILKPILPPAFEQQCRQGVAVVLVRVDSSGHVDHIEALTSPSPAITKAMIEAVSQWTFLSGEDANEPTGYMGKVTFYFLRDHGRSKVLDPFSDRFTWDGTTSWCPIGS
jgi:hypothetical protein